MTPSQIEAYLHEHIPLSAAMGVAVESAERDAVVLAAPLEPNINHRETVFGGSATTLAILAAWTLLHLRLRDAGFGGQLVIQQHTMHYDAPASGRFRARAGLDATDDWERFARTLARRGRARIALEAVVEDDAGRAGRLCGTFVALDGD